MVWMTRILFFFFVLASIATISSLLKSKKIEQSPLLDLKSDLKNLRKPFVISQKAYTHLGEGFLGSKSLRIKKELDESLKYLGANTRPDYPKASLFLSYKGKALIFNEKESYPLSLILENDLEASADYYFEADPLKDHLDIKIFYQKDFSFSLPLPLARATVGSQVGTYKLDNYLLVRQKVCWLGKDRFLNDYGGKEYQEIKDSERLDFMDQSSPYFLFAKKGDLFAYKENRWQKSKGDSKEYPLMAIEQVEPQMIEVSIWDVTGLQKEKVLISKTKAGQIPKNLSPLKFIGARSNQKWLFKADKARLSLEPGDWLLNLGHKWDKLNSIESIDRYVNHLNVGELFIVKELVEQNGKKILKGELYNLNRTERVAYSLDVSSDPKVRKTKSLSSK